MNQKQSNGETQDVIDFGASPLLSCPFCGSQPITSVRCHPPVKFAECRKCRIPAMPIARWQAQLHRHCMSRILDFMEDETARQEWQNRNMPIAALRKMNRLVRELVLDLSKAG
jgi:hypothetical protein